MKQKNKEKIKKEKSKNDPSMFYIVYEIQIVSGAKNVLNYAFDSQKSAQGKYYSILSAATQSQADYIGATLTQCGDNITLLMSKAYDNRLSAEQ